ncbi:MAG: type IV pilus biogenesis/stability protein PilW [Gammaproteobacteria bacterium]|nr:MAG: type IV pilus biogenesis/stability protein PilW [Gammaproteobacteria bacterium]
MKAKLTLALGLVLLGGCVTERSGTQLPEPSIEEAARLNYELGYRYFLQGDLPEAQAKLEKAIDQNPKLAEAHTALAMVYERLGDREAAERQYRRSVSLSPKNPDAIEALAVYLCRSGGREQEALREFDRAIAIPLSVHFTDKAALLANAGVCAKRVDLAKAEEYLRLALRSNPGYAEALLQLADVAYRREHHLQARAFLERYLGVSEPNPAALWLGVQIEQALGDVQAASRYAAELKSRFPESAETSQLLERERNAG